MGGAALTLTLTLTLAPTLTLALTLTLTLALTLTLTLALALALALIGDRFDVQIKLNRFNIIVLTMHRWFDVSAAQRDLKYEPIIPYSVG